MGCCGSSSQFLCWLVLALKVIFCFCWHYAQDWVHLAGKAASLFQERWNDDFETGLLGVFLLVKFVWALYVSAFRYHYHMYLFEPFDFTSCTPLSPQVLLGCQGFFSRYARWFQRKCHNKTDETEFQYDHGAKLWKIKGDSAPSSDSAAAPPSCVSSTALAAGSTDAKSFQAESCTPGAASWARGKDLKSRYVDTFNAGSQSCSKAVSNILPSSAVSPLASSTVRFFTPGPNASGDASAALLAPTCEETPEDGTSPELTASELQPRKRKSPVQRPLFPENPSSAASPILASDIPDTFDNCEQTSEDVRHSASAPMQACLAEHASMVLSISATPAKSPSKALSKFKDASPGEGGFPCNHDVSSTCASIAHLFKSLRACYMTSVFQIPCIQISADMMVFV